MYATNLHFVEVETWPIKRAHHRCSRVDITRPYQFVVVQAVIFVDVVSQWHTLPPLWVVVRAPPTSITTASQLRMIMKTMKQIELNIDLGPAAKQVAHLVVGSSRRRHASRQRR